MLVVMTRPLPSQQSDTTWNSSRAPSSLPSALARSSCITRRAVEWNRTGRSIETARTPIAVARWVSPLPVPLWNTRHPAVSRKAGDSRSAGPQPSGKATRGQPWPSNDSAGGTWPCV